MHHLLPVVPSTIEPLPNCSGNSVIDTLARAPRQLARKLFDLGFFNRERHTPILRCALISYTAGHLWPKPTAISPPNWKVATSGERSSAMHWPPPLAHGEQEPPGTRRW